MIQGTTLKPTIVKEKKGRYVIIGSIDPGMQIPASSIKILIDSLKNVRALLRETPEENDCQFQAMSTEILTKVSVGDVPIEYLSGNKIDEDIGDLVLKYVPRPIAEVYVPCLYVRMNPSQTLNDPNSIIDYVELYQRRFGFINVTRTMDSYQKVKRYWGSKNLDLKDLDEFSYDFEKFFGDIKEFELWQKEIRDFRKRHRGKIAVACGDYHVSFVKDVLDKKPINLPDWENHIDNRREDNHTPQDSSDLKRIYCNLEQALKS